MSASNDSHPIACTLAPGAFLDRLAWVAELQRDALRHLERYDLALVLTYDPAAADRVRELVRREQACCSFLTFDLREAADAVRLTITAPERARLAADLLFAQFARGGPRSPTATSHEKRVGVGTLTVATGAVAFVACCILPVALPALALAGTGAVFAWLGRVSGWFTGLAIAATACAWIWIVQRAIRSRARPAPATLYLVGAATALVAVAMLWPRIEPYVLRALHS
jgi:hypothetical protein